MNITYNKLAISAYLDKLKNMCNEMLVLKDGGANTFVACKQQYTRLVSEAEQNLRKHKNKLEYLNSIQSAAFKMLDDARRVASHSDDESEQNGAVKKIHEAQLIVEQTEDTILKEKENCAKAKERTDKLNKIYEQYIIPCNTYEDIVENSLASFIKLAFAADSELNTYMSEMSKAYAELADVREGISTEINISHNGNRKSMSSIDETISLHKSRNRYDTISSEMQKEHKFAQDTLEELQKNLPASLEKETILAATQNRKLRSPEQANKNQGYWQGNLYKLDDSFVPKGSNEEKLTIAQIKKELRNKFNIKFNAIPFNNGIADFSCVSLANIATRDIVMAVKGFSLSEYNGKNQHERVKIFSQVFGKGLKNENKRSINFSIADKIAAERQITIPGLQKNYTAKDLYNWRTINKFTWDEQLGAGYNLVPTVIHRAISHTGLVGISQNAQSYLETCENNIKAPSDDLYLSEENAPISINEV